LAASVVVAALVCGVVRVSAGAAPFSFWIFLFYNIGEGGWWLEVGGVGGVAMAAAPAELWGQVRGDRLWRCAGWLSAVFSL
jgi:hypothetical protein